MDPPKVVGVVHTNESDGGRGFSPPDETSRRIAAHVSQFLLDEMAAGRIPSQFLPLQSGVGNVCNAVVGGLAANDGFPQFKVYTEVLQDSMLDLIAAGSVIGASTCSLTLTDEKLKFLYEYFDEFADRIVLRPQEISNNPGIARRLGVIATNTAIEVDIYGHANSTHFFGTQIMNGLGGSGDFERNAYLSIFMCPSAPRGGRSRRSCRCARTSITASTRSRSSPPSKGWPTSAASRRSPGRGGSSTAAPIPPTGTICTTTWKARRWATFATTCGAASSSTSISRSTGRCCRTWTSPSSMPIESARLSRPTVGNRLVRQRCLHAP